MACFGECLRGGDFNHGIHGIHGSFLDTNCTEDLKF